MNSPDNWAASVWDSSGPNAADSQLVFDLDGCLLGPGWESLPVGARAAALVMLARLVAKAGLGEEATNG